MLKVNYPPVRVIQYLGSKLNLIPYIKKEIEEIIQPGGTVLDLFAGTGVVGYSLKDSYKIISNDVQQYSYIINKALLEKINEKTLTNLSKEEIFDSIYYEENYSHLATIFSEQLAYEEQVLSQSNLDNIAKLSESGIFYDGTKISDTDHNIFKIYEKVAHLFSKKRIEEYQNDNKKFPYMLFSTYYLNGYFSLKQCIEIDSARYAIDNITAYNNDMESTKNIYLVCLLHSISEVVSSIGKHFAQPAKMVDKNKNTKEFVAKRSLKDRQKSVEYYFNNQLNVLKKSLITSDITHQIYNLEYKELVKMLNFNNEKVDLVYIDPPYTIDHYSRFYHIPETLIRYDYPTLEKKKFRGIVSIMNGRYRDDRFQSNFCIPSRANLEFEKLVESVASLNSKLVISYSESNDEMDTRKRVITKVELVEILKKHFKDIKVINLSHKYRKLSKKEHNKEEISDAELLIICK